MAKRLLPNDIDVNDELAKRQHAENAEQSNIDAELLKEKQDPGSSEENDNTAAAAAAAAAVYGGLMGAHDDGDVDESQLHGHGHVHGTKTEDDVDVDVDVGKDDEPKRAGRRGRKPAPVTGSAEWRQQRKDSHKEVERRRRENINTAINKLSDLLPVKESSKATVLARAAEYIQKLKDTENANIEKWTLQKLLSEQQVSTLTKANESLQIELGNAFKQIDILKRQLKASGIPLDPEIEKLEAEGGDDK